MAYLDGIDVLGGDDALFTLAPAPSSPAAAAAAAAARGAGATAAWAYGPAIVIRIKNVDELIEKRGGKSGGFVYKLAPQTLTNKVYSEMQKKLTDGFLKEGVDADVSVLSSAPAGKRSMPDILTGAAVGALGVGALLLLKRLVRGK